MWVGTRADSITKSVVSSLWTLIVHKDIINIFNKYVRYTYIYQRVGKSNLLCSSFPLLELVPSCIFQIIKVQCGSELFLELGS